MAEFTLDGRIRYRLTFQDAGWPDSEDFTSTEAFSVGDTVEFEGEMWIVAAVESARAGVRDLLTLKPSSRTRQTIR
jgi:hypothetical protein